MDHAQKIDGNFHHWQCIYCCYIGKGEGITRMKMHLANEYLDVEKCKKVTTKVHKSFQDKLQQVREDTMKKKRQELKKNATGLRRNRFMTNMRVVVMILTRILDLVFVHH